MAVSEATLGDGFEREEWAIWQSFELEVLRHPIEERPDPDDWVDSHSAANGIERDAVNAVVKLGIYAGDRDELRQRTGNGKTVFPNGDIYIGEYEAGLRHGKGLYIHKAQGMGPIDELLARLSPSKPVGRSAAEFLESEVPTIPPRIIRSVLDLGFFPCYRGSYHRNAKQGKGVMKYKDGSYYEGQWDANKRHGDGMYHYTNGDTYNGAWHEGLKHGSGCYTFTGGRGSYAGAWHRGVLQDGRWLMADGTTYEGAFDTDNRPHDALGAMKFPAAKLRQRGQYQKGKWCPEFRLEYMDGTLAV